MVNIKEEIKNLMSDGKKRYISDVSEELDIPPREVHKVFSELDKENWW